MTNKYDPAQVIVDYCAAYVAANKKSAPKVIYRGGGWFSLNGRHSGLMRYRQIISATERLNARATENAAEQS